MSYAQARKLPYPPLLLRVLRATAVVWLLARCAYVAVLLVGVLLYGLLPMDEGIRAALHPTPLSRLLVIVLTAGLVWLDRRRAHEHLLQANMGVSPLWFWTASLLSAGVLDVGAQTLLRFF